MALIANQGGKRQTVLFAVMLCTVAFAQQFEMARSTIDGGGALRLTGGSFVLSGTIGQPDAGVMAGGSFELTGGFWFPYEPGDCNEDGKTGLRDFSGMNDCLAGPLAPVAANCHCYDLNKSDTIDLADFAEFQARTNGE